MKSSSVRRSFLALMAFWMSVQGKPLSADEEKGRIEPRQASSAVFQDAEIELRFTFHAPTSLKGRAAWLLTTLEKRTLARGELAVAAEPKEPAQLTVRLKTPTLKPGVVLPLVFLVNIYRDKGEQIEATYEHKLWVFPAEPFIDRSQWLKDLRIMLFDPIGKTGEVLTKFSIPFEETRNPAALAEQQEGLIVVGEGISFADYRDLPEALVKAAAKGRPVLCLAPEGGAFPLPGTAEATLPSPSALLLSRQDIITQLDKRLDAVTWGATVKPIVSTLAIKSGAGQVIGEIQKNEGGWPWLEIHYPQKGGRLIVCGFGIIQHWQANPTPRFLLAKLFELLDVTPPPIKKESAVP